MEAASIRAQAGRQREFCSSEADIAIYGGAAGGGKSWALLYEAAKWSHVKGYRASIFRRNATDIMAEGGLWDEAQEMYASLGGKPRESPRPTFTFASGARIGFDHLQLEKTKQRKQGLQLAFLGFDEVTHFTETQFWYLIGRLRSVCGVKPYCRATCNPDPDSFVRKLIGWWIGPDGLPIQARSGVLRWFVRLLGRIHWADTPEELTKKFPGCRPKSFTFIPAKLTDNPALNEADPDYEGNLDAQSLVDRARLKDGNWDIREIAGNLFRRAWFEVVDDIPSDVIRWVRCWDLAGTEPTDERPEPDWTRGVKVGLTRLRADKRPRYVIAGLASLRGTPGSVEALYKATAQQDGKNVTIGFWQDPAQAGKFQANYFKRALAGYHVDTVVANDNKIAYANFWSPDAEPKNGADYGDIILVRGEWNEAFLGEAEAFPEGKFDDIIDAISRAMLMLKKPRAAKAREVHIEGI